MVANSAPEFGSKNARGQLEFQNLSGIPKDHTGTTECTFELTHCNVYHTFDMPVFGRFLMGFHEKSAWACLISIGIT